MFVMHARQQGDIGEASAIQWLVFQGFAVGIPFGHSPDWDLVAEMDGRLVRVQVKTCTRLIRETGRWSVTICTRGGNQSWNGLVKRLDASRCDFLFVHVGDGRRWFIPADHLEGSTTVNLGGPKYAEFEVESGDPLPVRTRLDRAA
jgi:hypothetical protein